jgi:hypothetical protein
MNGTGGYTRPKPCSLCGNHADFSFVLLASTLRISPRRQNTSSAVNRLQQMYQAAITTLQLDEEGVLEMFSVASNAI